MLNKGDLGTRFSLVSGSVEVIPLGNDLVDCVISNGIIDDIADKEKVFKEVYRVLRPGGRFSIAANTLKTGHKPEIPNNYC